MSQQIKDGETKYQCHLCQKHFKMERKRSLHLNSCRKRHTVGDSHLALNTLTTVSSNSEDTHNLCTTNTMSLHTFGLPCVWGSLTNDELKQLVNATYEEIVFWCKNLFLFEKGKG